jgi:hypothetical protein
MKILPVVLNMKSSVFWDIVQCSALKVDQPFGRACHPAYQLLSCWFFAWLVLLPWRWRWHVPLKCKLTFNRLHLVISQKIELFITTAVRTSNPAWFSTCFVHTDRWKDGLSKLSRHSAGMRMSLKKAHGEATNWVIHAYCSYIFQI